MRAKKKLEHHQNPTVKNLIIKNALTPSEMKSQNTHNSLLRMITGSNNFFVAGNGMIRQKSANDVANVNNGSNGHYNIRQENPSSLLAPSMTMTTGRPVVAQPQHRHLPSQSLGNAQRPPRLTYSTPHAPPVPSASMLNPSPFPNPVLGGQMQSSIPRSRPPQSLDVTSSDVNFHEFEFSPANLNAASSSHNPREDSDLQEMTNNFGNK